MVNLPEKALIKHILTCGVLFSALVAGCGEESVGPGNVARPLVGSYDLESRTVNTATPSDTGRVLAQTVLVPPQVRGFLRLGIEGRYGQVDTTVVLDSTAVHIQNGRWSVLDDVFYFVTDDNQQFENRFTFDGLRLVRISEEIQHTSGSIYFVQDTWLKQSDDEPEADP